MENENNTVINNKVLVKSIALYACDVWAKTKTEKNKLVTFKRKILRRIFSPKNTLRDFELRTN